MNLPPKAWYESWPANVQCSVAPERAEENARYLEGVFGKAWIDRSLQRGDQHPVINMWRSAGDQMAFLQLNTLAEDLRELEAVPGLRSLIGDMKRASAYLPAAHTVHVAALFSRGGNPLQRFFAPGNLSVPDFETIVSGTRVPVEAKQLTNSEPSRRFSRAAFALQDQLDARIFRAGESYPEIRILVGDPLKLPSVDEVIEGIEVALSEYLHGVTVNARSENVSIQLVPAIIVGGMDEHRAVQVISPRDDSEDARVERLLNKANKQLKKNMDGKEPGLLCLAIGEHQDPHVVVELIRRKFEGGQYRTTSGVVVHRYARHVGPGPIATADLLAFIPNPQARVTVPSFNLRGTGVTGHLIENTPKDGTISCYSVAWVSGRVTDASAEISMGINPVQRIEIAALPKSTKIAAAQPNRSS